MPLQTSELLNDVKQVLDISSRVDERVKLIQVNQAELNSRFNALVDDFNNLSARVMVIESRNGGKSHEIEEKIGKLHSRVDKIDVNTEAFRQSLGSIKKLDKEESIKIHDMIRRIYMLEHDSEGWQGKIKQWGGLVVQGIWVIIVCYLLLKLGLNPAPLP
jgi:chromosome segregation ATPase